MTPDWEERLFDGRPTPLRLYRAIRQRLETFGPLTVRGTDTQVSFRARRAFAWVWLPQRWAEERPADGPVHKAISASCNQKLAFGNRPSSPQ